MNKKNGVYKMKLELKLDNYWIISRHNGEKSWDLYNVRNWEGRADSLDGILNSFIKLFLKKEKNYSFITLYGNITASFYVHLCVHRCMMNVHKESEDFIEQLNEEELYTIKKYIKWHQAE